MAKSYAFRDKQNKANNSESIFQSETVGVQDSFAQPGSFLVTVFWQSKRDYGPRVLDPVLLLSGHPD